MNPVIKGRQQMEEILKTYSSVILATQSFINDKLLTAVRYQTEIKFYTRSKTANSFLLAGASIENFENFGASKLFAGDTIPESLNTTQALNILTMIQGTNYLCVVTGEFDDSSASEVTRDTQSELSVDITTVLNSPIQTENFLGMGDVLKGTTLKINNKIKDLDISYGYAAMPAIVTNTTGIIR